MPIVRRKSTYVSADSDEDDEFYAYCRYCRVIRHELNLLGPILLEENEEIPSDFDKWKQCPKCERKERIEETRQEGELFTDIELTSSDVIEQVSRKSRLAELREERLEKEIPDPEVRKLIKQGLKIENYVEYNPE